MRLSSSTVVWKWIWIWTVCPCTSNMYILRVKTVECGRNLTLNNVVDNIFFYNGKKIKKIYYCIEFHTFQFLYICIHNNVCINTHKHLSFMNISWCQATNTTTIKLFLMICNSYSNIP